MMVAYSFKSRFGWLVEDGIKRQTIRRPRQRQTVVGDRLQLYQDQRTAQCRLLRESSCTEVLPVVIDEGEIHLHGRVLDYSAMRFVAWKDGFRRPEDLFAFFGDLYALPFLGQVVRWDVATLSDFDLLYGVMDMSYHVNVDRVYWNGLPGWKRDSFTAQMMHEGMSLWRSPSGRVIGTMAGDRRWVDRIGMWPDWAMRGVPVGWELLEG